MNVHFMNVHYVNINSRQNRECQENSGKIFWLDCGLSASKVLKDMLITLDPGDIRKKNARKTEHLCARRLRIWLLDQTEIIISPLILIFSPF